ncbi:helix-turn-helix domain-containing protein [Enterococcus thailandicus]|uniref:helix-turn-helix domain-containing protein n=1 Tax=Enterococcus thailandicus TaxID=417368 RepID=UPI0035D702DE
MEFKDRIKFLREEKGWTKKLTAEKLGISIGAYANYEYGNREPNQEITKRIASAFDVSVEYLLTGKNPVVEAFNSSSLSDSARGAAKQLKNSILEINNYFIEEIDFDNISNQKMADDLKKLDAFFLSIANKERNMNPLDLALLVKTITLIDTISRTDLSNSEKYNVYSFAQGVTGILTNKLSEQSSNKAVFQEDAVKQLLDNIKNTL